MHDLGHTRSARCASHLLHTPDTFVRTRLPGSDNLTAVVHISPAMGAAFTQYTAEFAAGGHLGASAGQRFVYVLSGELTLAYGRGSRQLSSNDYAYIPAGVEHTLTAPLEARVAVVEKPYIPVANEPAPDVLVGREAAVEAQPLMGDPDLLVRSLLPDTLAFDFAVNTMSYAPGAGLSMVETHVMEHGLLMLEGGGIYQLDERWYPVRAGDFIWMAPYCPQWFGAIGKTPAKYLIYKDWNRHPLA